MAISRLIWPIHYHCDFERGAVGTLQRAYDFLGFELRPQVQSEMLRRRQANHSGAHGTHRYTAEQYGLGTAQLRSDYDCYIRQFNVPLEG